MVSVKAKLRNRFRQFDVPVDTQLNRLTGTLKERFGIHIKREREIYLINKKNI